MSPNSAAEALPGSAVSPRPLDERVGLPPAMYTDALSLFLHSPAKEAPAEVFARSANRPGTALRPPPSSTLLDLHLSLRASRKVHSDIIIEFDGKPEQMTPKLKKYVPILFHPPSKLWVLEEKPDRAWPTILGHFSL